MPQQWQLFYANVFHFFARYYEKKTYHKNGVTFLKLVLTKYSSC